MQRKKNPLNNHNQESSPEHFSYVCVENKSNVRQVEGRRKLNIEYK